MTENMPRKPPGMRHLGNLPTFSFTEGCSYSSSLPTRAPTSLHKVASAWALPSSLTLPYFFLYYFFLQFTPATRLCLCRPAHHCPMTRARGGGNTFRPCDNTAFGRRPNPSTRSTITTFVHRHRRFISVCGRQRRLFAPPPIAAQRMSLWVVWSLPGAKQFAPPCEGVGAPSHLPCTLKCLRTFTVREICPKSTFIATFDSLSLPFIYSTYGSVYYGLFREV